MSMKILIAGGTGYVGQKLGQALARAGHEMVVLTRRPHKAQVEMTYPAQLLSWQDLEESLKRGALRFDGVINLAGEGIADQRWSEERKQALRDSRVQLTSDLRRIVSLQSQRPSVWLQASAVGIYGDRGDEWLYEMGEQGTGFLADLCRDWEASLSQDSADRSVIFRIGVVIGQGSGFLRALEPLWQMGAGGVLGSGRQWLSWIHVEDLVEAFMQALGDQKFSGVYNAVSPEPVRNRELTKILSAALRVPALIPTPTFALKLVLGEMAEAVLGSQRVSAHKLTYSGFKFRYGTLQEALGSVYGGLEPGEVLVEYSQFLSLRPEVVFPFFASEDNLEKITPPYLNFKVLSKSTSEIEVGTRIHYRLKLHGVPLRWRTVIAEWVPGEKFVDMQESGPYQKWHHTHKFERLSGGTLMTDTVRFKLPLGRLGLAVAGWWVRRDVNGIFSYRKSSIRPLLPQDQSFSKPQG